MTPQVAALQKLARIIKIGNIAAMNMADAADLLMDDRRAVLNVVAAAEAHHDAIATQATADPLVIAALVDRLAVALRMKPGAVDAVSAAMERASQSPIPNTHFPIPAEPPTLAALRAASSAPRLSPAERAALTGPVHGSIGIDARTGEGFVSPTVPSPLSPNPSSYVPPGTDESSPDEYDSFDSNGSA